MRPPSVRRALLFAVVGSLVVGLGTAPAFAAPTHTTQTKTSRAQAHVPTARVRKLYQTRTGACIKGWASDPDTIAPIDVQITVDGTAEETVLANRDVYQHPGHGFATAVPVTSGKHTVCAIGMNAGAGTQNSAPACQTLTFAFSPVGAYTALRRATDGSDALLVRGYAFDPDTYGAIDVSLTLDGAVAGTVPADHWRQDVAARFPRFGHKHGFADRVAADAGEHTVCVVADNVGGGSDTNLGCLTVPAVTPEPPSAPQQVTATANGTTVTVRWAAPASDGGTPLTGYQVTSTPASTTTTVPASSTSATITGLVPNTTYTFSLLAQNAAGTSQPGTSNPVTPTNGPPPQTTPAPVSTSRYVRNITGASATVLAKMRREGYADAQANPSGHRYLILLDIGGQDQYDGGVVLSATTRFVSYGDLEKDLQSYVAGYASGQRGGAPVIIAAGTN